MSPWSVSGLNKVLVTCFADFTYLSLDESRVRGTEKLWSWLHDTLWVSHLVLSPWSVLVQQNDVHQMFPFFYITQLYGRELNHCEDEIGRRDVLFWWELVPPKLLVFNSGRGIGVEAGAKSGQIILDNLSSLPSLNTMNGSQRVMFDGFTLTEGNPTNIGKKPVTIHCKKRNCGKSQSFCDSQGPKPSTEWILKE